MDEPLQTPDDAATAGKTPLRLLVRNEARNWAPDGKVRGMVQFAKNVWWFRCRDEDGGGHDGYIVASGVAGGIDITKVPGYREFAIHTLPAGHVLYAFDDSTDYILLEDAFPDLARHAYEKGYDHDGQSAWKDVLDDDGTPFFASFEVYQAYLRAGVERHFSEAR